MKKYWFLILFVLIFEIAVSASDFADHAVEVSGVSSFYADAAVLYNKTTDEFIIARNADARLPIASTTKIMTALVALENSPADSIVTVHKDAVGVEGSSIYLEAGEKIPLRDMLYALMLESANDSAVAIAIHVAGSVEAFVGLMNDKAQALGMGNTHFENPHGLPHDNHYSSASDMARLFSHALDNADFAQITAAKSYKSPLKSDGYRYFSNHNRLLSLLDGCIGGKTGYTKKAGRCLVSGTARDDIYMICVTLNAGDDWNIHKELTEYGFSLYERRSVAENGEFSFNVPIVGGKTEYARVSNVQEISICSKKTSPPVTHTVELFIFYYPPVAKGEKAGRVVFRQGGEYIGEVDLYFEDDVNIKAPKSFWSRMLGK
ncbi:MAG: D-alanyl-D-alanine carboxypeptidase [Ruminococcaceae bacterium]|nr:D-alanyl-D-alanine carboxypeptidase [Oscillospiraceae bacterium]